MKITKLSWMSRLFPAVVSIVGVSAIVVACGNGDDDDTTPVVTNDAGGTGAETSTNASCTTPTPGEMPGATCDFSGSACSAASGSCTVTQSATCNAASACLAPASNTGTTDNFRLSALYLAAPKALTLASVQGTIVNSGLEFDNAACGQNGNALFNWLMTLDTAANTLKTGGAPVPTDTSGNSGFCYENDTQDGLPVAPVTVPVTKAADGTYSTTNPIPALNIPFGIAGSTSIIVLPLHNLQISDVTVSDNGNCIGSYKTSGTTTSDPIACSDIDSCQRWTTSASLGAYITLAEADKVQVVQLQESLCALLSLYQPGTKSSTGTCTTNADGSYVAQGDWCTTANGGAGGPATATCADAYWLSSTFAASAVKVADTCN